MKMSFSLT